MTLDLIPTPYIPLPSIASPPRRPDGTRQWPTRESAAASGGAVPSFAVVDDFFDDPWLQRRIALSCAFEAERPAFRGYGGQNEIETPASRLLHDTAAKKIAAFVGGTIRYHCVYRINRTGSHLDGRAYIHHDTKQYSAVIYLNPPEQCTPDGGTFFWRHKARGWASFADMQKEYPDRSHAELRRIIETELGNGRRVEDWENTEYISMKWNRLLLFRGDLFHSAGVAFGATKDDARLIEAFGFSIVVDPGDAKTPDSAQIGHDANWEIHPAPERGPVPHTLG